jgi:uncharacterized protein
MAKKMNPVNWFEIPVKDLDRASRFYESVFGIKLQHEEMGPMKMAWFPMQEKASSAAGSLVKMDGYTPSHSGTVVYFSVSDIEGTLAKIEANKGRTLLPKMAIGEYGFIAQFEDTEGNRIALHTNS